MNIMYRRMEGRFYSEDREPMVMIYNHMAVWEEGLNVYGRKKYKRLARRAYHKSIKFQSQ